MTRTEFTKRLLVAPLALLFGWRREPEPAQDPEAEPLDYEFWPDGEPDRRLPWRVAAYIGEERSKWFATDRQSWTHHPRRVARFSAVDGWVKLADGTVIVGRLAPWPEKKAA